MFRDTFLIGLTLGLALSASPAQEQNQDFVPAPKEESVLVEDFRAQLEEASQEQIARIKIAQLPPELVPIAVEAKEKLPIEMLRRLPVSERRLLAEESVYLYPYLIHTLPFSSPEYDQAVNSGKINLRGSDARLIETITVEDNQTKREVRFIAPSKDEAEKLKPDVILSSGHHWTVVPHRNGGTTFSFHPGEHIDFDKKDKEEDETFDFEMDRDNGEFEPAEGTSIRHHRDFHHHPIPLRSGEDFELNGFDEPGPGFERELSPLRPRQGLSPRAPLGDRPALPRRQGN